MNEKLLLCIDMFYHITQCSIWTIRKTWKALTQVVVWSLWLIKNGRPFVVRAICHPGGRGSSSWFTTEIRCPDSGTGPSGVVTAGLAGDPVSCSCCCRRPSGCWDRGESTVAAVACVLEGATSPDAPGADAMIGTRTSWVTNLEKEEQQTKDGYCKQRLICNPSLHQTLFVALNFVSINTTFCGL